MSPILLALTACKGPATVDSDVPVDTDPPAETGAPDDTDAPGEHDLTGAEPDVWTTYGGPSTFDRLPDGRVLVGLQQVWSNEFCGAAAASAAPWPWAQPYPETLDGGTWMTASDYATLPVGGCTRLGERAFAVGDTNGDGLEEVVLTAAQPSSLLGAHAMVVDGALLQSPYVEGPLELAPTVADVGGWLARCDVDGDGLADLCSTHGVALGPPPYAVSAPFADATEADRVVWAQVDGVPGLVLSRGAVLSFVPASALPPAGGIADLATETSSASGPVLALAVSDVHPGDGPELVAVVRTGDAISVVAWALTAGLPERVRLDTPALAGDSGALAFGDFDGDGVRDVAFASRQRVGVVAGPLREDAVPVWWKTRVLPTLPSSFGNALLVEPGDAHDALWVGDAERQGPFSPAVGAAFRLPDPLLPP
ncbi:MAG: hypothetical protein H6737_19040 [Alphaproteobacteria bacterium]|nr:hypothetical protein [Alphaproteobacteria bacterium]